METETELIMMKVLNSYFLNNFFINYNAFNNYDILISAIIFLMKNMRLQKIIHKLADL